MNEPVYRGTKSGVSMYLYRPASEDMTEELEKMERSRDFWESRARHLDAMRRAEFHDRVEARLAYMEKKDREAAERKGKRSERLALAACRTMAIIVFTLYVARFVFA